MNNNIKEYLNRLMISIPSGVEYLRDYRDENKWISSDSKMSIPGQKGNLTAVERKFEPAVNVSWYDAFSFCNLLSKECGRNFCGKKDTLKSSKGYLRVNIPMLKSIFSLNMLM